MWIPKWQRDQTQDVDSPIPTQAVSNEEFVPRPQTEQQRRWEQLIGELSEQNSKKLGIPRRDFMRTSMGMATAFLASNMVYGPHWDVDATETLDPSATEEKFPKGEYFIVDSFSNYVKEIFFDSETSMAVISGVPGRETNKNLAGKVLEGRDRRGGILPSWLMSQRKRELNELAGGTRAFCQGNCAPNHYWNRKTNSPDFPALFDQMEREVNTYGIDSWKWYGHTDPGKSGDGFRLDDEKMTYPFYEKSKELGLKVISVHKGFAAQSRTLGHFAHPGDIEKAALDHPDFTFIAYHSALKHGPSEPQFKRDGFFDPETGDFAWHADLMKIKERNPEMNNVYCEIGSSFGLLGIAHPEMCQHLIGKNVKHYGSDHVLWGTDCLWWGSPQWVIDAMKRFQISDELCDKFGYAKLTKEDKANIFGLNAAKIYGFDVAEQLQALPADSLSRFKPAYLERGGKRDHAAQGWVRANA
jgi:predicted TIM-barrel fold metal-dependent hydrolase